MQLLMVAGVSGGSAQPVAAQDLSIEAAITPPRLTEAKPVVTTTNPSVTWWIVQAILGDNQVTCVCIFVC